ncbi:MAG TPA: hypothetical protein VE046_03510 [Steroidobacteraceae bacterium]|nr:hypothetical protein [Steroidobacteraceae bacterium]
MKATLFVTSLLCLLAVARAEEPTNGNVADFAAKYEAKCHDDYAARLKQDRKQGNSPTKADQIRAESLEKAKCECMAGKVRSVTDTDLSHAILAKDSTVTGPFYLRAYQECMASAARETMLPLCLIEAKSKPSSKAEAGICHCIADETAKVDEKTYVDETVAAYQRYEAQAKDPNAPRFQGKLAKIETSCRARAGQ